jgi:hypothetical protein
MTQQSITNYQTAPVIVPFAQQSKLLDRVSTVPYEGIWTPMMFPKTVAIECVGSWSTVNVNLVVSCALEIPNNTVTVTVGGTIHTGDNLNVTFGNALLTNATQTITYVVQAGDTITTAAAALAALISVHPNLAQCGYQATSVAGAISITFPSNATNLPNNANYLGSPLTPPANNTQFSISVTGTGATTTLTYANGTDGTPITPSLTSNTTQNIQAAYRYIKARLTTLTGSNAYVDVNLAGNG